MLRIGIDLGGTKTEGIVMDDAGKILARERRPTPQAEGYDAILANIRELVLDLERHAGNTCRVGIGTPGAISAKTGCLKNSNTVCMNGKPVQHDLERVLARALRIANDANCFALSEALDGAAQGCASAAGDRTSGAVAAQGCASATGGRTPGAAAARGALVVFGVILGTGVGGGIVFRGQLHQGLHHIAGEWGHNVLEANGPPCYCGRRGCVETFLSGPGLLHDYRARGGDAAHDTHTIVARAATGDRLAEAAMQSYLDRFGRALSTVINILDPDVVVLGGGMSNIARLYTEGRERVAHHVFNDELRTRVLPNQHGDSSGVRGAAQLWPVGE